VGTEEAVGSVNTVKYSARGVCTTGTGEVRSVVLRFHAVVIEQPEPEYLSRVKLTK
jgi:hypothetical protein